MQLQPMNQNIDEMLTRLDEFEAMVALVQQERCNAIGITGSLSETIDYREELDNLCRRIDGVEKLVGHIKENINVLEAKVEAAEIHYGVVDNATKLKNFFTPLFVSLVQIYVLINFKPIKEF